MEFKGTKGNWSIDDIGISNGMAPSVLVDKVNTICTVYGENQEASEANAKLIASAPELLEALQMVTTQFQDLLDSLYGKNIYVMGWHQNGEGQCFDTFIDDSDEGGLEKAEQAINKALK